MEAPVHFLERPMSEDPNDQLLLQIRGAVSEYERCLIAERMRRGRQHKYRAGLLLPWTRPPYGYRLDPDHLRDPAGVRVEATEGAIVSELFARYVQPGQSLSSLSNYLKHLNVPTPTGKKRSPQCHAATHPDQSGLYRGRLCRTQAGTTGQTTSLGTGSGGSAHDDLDAHLNRAVDCRRAHFSPGHPTVF
jgi:DNA invertase Pin-like site-specific DNA recombinase